MSQDDLYINGELLRLGREARGWVLSDMATRACMSVKQIRQLEEGGTSAFYSPAVKMTSAKKLAGILELSLEQVFNRPNSVEADAVASPVAESDGEHAADQTVVAQDAVVQDTVPAHSEPVLAAAEPHEASASDPVVDEPKGKTSVWAIVALFVAALGVAAYMHQQEEPATEPPPPLQVVPAEPEAAASAPDAAASGASAATDHPAAPAASAPAVSASVATPAVAAPAAPAAPKPAASAASKPL